MVEVFSHEGSGFQAVMQYEGWRVAIMNHAPHQTKEAITQLSRHLCTDEAFALVEGCAVLYWADGEVPVDIHCTPLVRGSVLNVHRGTWHTMVTQPGARIVVMENSDTGAHNSEKYPVSLPNDAD